MNYIKNVSVSLGTNQHSDTAIACVAWDEYGVLPDEYGAIRCRYVNAANGADVPLNQGVLDAAADVNIYRKPCVIMSGNTSQSEAGPGTSDLRTAITFEYNNGLQAGVRGVINDSVLTGQVTFMSPYYFSAPGTLIEPHGVYDNLADTFRMTYYDTTGKTLVYDRKAANSTATTDFSNINPNYRDATGAMELPVAPRMDFSPANNMAVLVWNDNGLTMLDTQYVVQPLFVNAVATSTGYELYPNPSVGTINCSFAAAAEELAVLSVCDIRGAELIHRDISIRAGSNTVAIAAGDLPAGNYILKIRGSLSNVCGKFSICD